MSSLGDFIGPQLNESSVLGIDNRDIGKELLLFMRNSDLSPCQNDKEVRLY
jgi:hypothetical protein